MTKQECCFERPNFIMANRKSKKSVRRTIAATGMVIVGAGLDSWYKTGIRRIGGRWCRTGFCWCRKVVTGSGLLHFTLDPYLLCHPFYTGMYRLNQSIISKSVCLNKY